MIIVIKDFDINDVDNGGDDDEHGERSSSRLSCPDSVEERRSIMHAEIT